jgi:hypothetical protein
LGTELNTPAHIVINLAVLTRGSDRRTAWPVLAGAVVPDLPMFAFYLWHRLVAGLSESEIWSEAYFWPASQILFDWFNSLPLATMILGGALLAGNRGLTLLSTSVLLHIALDLPLHHDDGHRHFLPLSSWRFESPISYWDPAHLGILGAGVEIICVLSASIVLARRFPRPMLRGALGLLCLLYSAGYLSFYLLR